MNPLTQFRASKDDFFAHNPRSPLTPEQKKHFHGLTYFPENPDLRLELPLEKLENAKSIQIQTTTGHIQEYTRFGLIHFQVEGQAATLTIYTNEYGLFLPFVDSLAGAETYPAGRYLEPVEMEDGRYLVDFNLAYNPYCAYNDAWSCPLTPWENRLKVAIRAGEKLFHQ
jgi:uncharacterized protein (DUF1684 family)